MKVVINSCFGGFSLSNKAVKRYAELQGRECYFFEIDYNDNITKIAEDSDSWSVFAFDISDPKSVEKELLWEKHYMSDRPEDRADPLLVQVVEELEKEANGTHAELKIVDIPDGVEYEISEYDGYEHVAEIHRTWS